MKAAPKLSLLYLLACFSFLLAACSGVKQTSGGGGGGGSAIHTISATVSGLSGTGLVLQDNGADNLTVSANGTSDPGSRWGAGYWIDNDGQFWMFGGEGFDASSGNGNGLLNDLWRYLPFPK